MTRLSVRLKKIWRILCVADYRRALLKGCFVRADCEAELKLIGPLDLIVDAGAFDGGFLVVARHFNPKARLIAVEPQAEPARRLKRVFSGKALQHFACALADKAGRQTLQQAQKPQASSLLKSVDALLSVFPETRIIGQEEVEVATLDELLLPLEDWPERALLKLDVQGAEALVLAGGRESLKRFSWVLIELAPEPLYEGQKPAIEVVCAMEAAGFSLRGQSDPLHDRYQPRKILEADYLFSRN